MVLPFPYQIPQDIELRVQNSERIELKELTSAERLLVDWHTSLPHNRASTTDKIRDLPRLLSELTSSIDLLNDAKKHESRIKKMVKAVIDRGIKGYETKYGKSVAEKPTLELEEGISERIEKAVKLLEEARRYCINAREKKTFMDPIHVWDDLVSKAWMEVARTIREIRYVISLEIWLDKQ
ncbi:MAG TPA: hypothetical protein VI934_02370 [Candidatus Nanoarchaeia archaeon]|nr:hypothetical protein [Candidatus Nanoarchaeia archaeon]